MISDTARALFADLAALTPSEREARLRLADAERHGGVLSESEVTEVRALLRAHDFSPGFLEPVALAWRDEPPNALPVMPAVHAGARIGSFSLLREVGRGGMGVVFEAEQAQPRRRVALKLMKPGAHGAADLSRFRREAELLGRLNHPNIAAVYEARVTQADASGEALPYLAMEFVRGVAVTEFCRGRSAREIVGLMAATCDAVAHAHALGVVHRDLSPSNILVDGEGRVKIVDFGVATLAEGAAAGSLATAGAHVVGKWAYMSPEQALGAPGAIDQRTDVFALGAVLYELLAGRPWIDPAGQSAVRLLRAIERDDPAPLGSIRREARGDLQAVVATAMHKDRNRRYQSAAELQDELKRWLSGNRVHAREPGFRERLSRLIAQNRGIAAGVGVALGALTIGLAMATSQWVRAARSEERLIVSVHTVLDGVVAAISRTMQSVEARSAALREIEPAVQKLLASAPRDPEIRALGARYYIRQAEVEGYPYVPNRGRTDTAIGLLSQAIAIATPRGFEAETNESCAMEGLRAWHLLEDTRLREGRVHEGEDDAEGALRAVFAWVERSGAAPQWLELAAVLTRNEMRRRFTVDRTQDVSGLRDAMREQLLRPTAHPASPEEAKQIASAWLALANAGAATDLCEAVPDACARARDALRQWLASPAADPDEWLNLMDTYRHEGACLASLGRMGEALASADAAVALTTELLTRHSTRANMSIALGLALTDRGRLLSMMGDDRAIEDLERAIEAAKAMREEDATPEISARRVATAYRRLAEGVERLRLAGVEVDSQGRRLALLAEQAVAEIRVRLSDLGAGPESESLRAFADSSRAVER